MRERTFIFNDMLYDTVRRVLDNYEEKADHIAADDMYRVLDYIRDTMAKAKEVKE